MNDKFSLRDYPLKAASLYVSALSFILENTIASSIRDTFLSTDEKMCIKILGKNNEYRLTEKAKEEYKLTLPLTPNSSMSYTTSSNIQGLAR